MEEAARVGEAHRRNSRQPEGAERELRLCDAGASAPPPARPDMRGVTPLRPAEGSRGSRGGPLPPAARGAGRPHAVLLRQAAVLPGRRRRPRAQGCAPPDPGLANTLGPFLDRAVRRLMDGW